MTPGNGPEAVHDAARRGASGAHGPLPYLEQIQKSFGHHDVRGVKAHTDSKAVEGSQAMGAEAFAMGNHVAFAGAPSLHTAAHEAAHIVQQRGGIQLKGGVGEVNDPHEQHANQVADRVVAGHSAEPLLDSYVATPSAGASTGIQRMPRMADEQAVSLRYHASTGAPAGPTVQRKIGDGLDKNKLEADGKGAHLEAEASKAAIAANDKKWTGTYRLELLKYLRGGGAVAEGEEFSDADVQHVAQLQKGAGSKVDGIITDATIAVLLHAGMKFSPGAGKDQAHPTGQPKASEVLIEFWPGELEDLDAWKIAIEEAKKAASANGTAPMRELKAPEGVGKLYVKVSGRLVAKYDARGGPPRPIKDVGGHTADPTQGSFTVGPQQKGFTTKSWPMSQVPNGTQIRRKSKDHFEMHQNGAWKPMPAGLMDDAAWRLLKPVDLAPDGQVDTSAVTGTDNRIKTYDLNDFGDMAYKLKPDKGQADKGFYVHTTPDNEIATYLKWDVTLEHSHGCVHVPPKDRDEMIARGYLKEGVRFVCKRYDEHLLPETARRQMQGS